MGAFLLAVKVQKSFVFRESMNAACSLSCHHAGSVRCRSLISCFWFQGHAADVFEAYTQLLTEMVLRLPYQIKKIADTNSRIPPPIFDHSWFYFLSEVSENVIHLQILTKKIQ